MDTVEALKTSVQANAAPAPAPYFAEFELERAEPRPDADIAHYPGLLVYHLVRPESSEAARPRVYTYWATHDHYVRDANSFRAAIGAAPALAHGYMMGLATHARPWWRRWQWHTVVLGIAAFFGAVQALGNYYDWIFAAPYLGVKWDRTRLHLIQGAELKESATLVNNLPVAHRDVALSAVLRPPSGPDKQATAEPGLVPHLPGGDTHEVMIAGIVPEPGEYLLVLHAKAGAGRLRFAHAFRFQRPVTVWPKAPTARLSVKALGLRSAMLSGELLLGPEPAGGLDCELEIRQMPGLALDDPSYFPKIASELRLRTNDSPGNEVALLTWQVQRTPGRESLPFHVSFTSGADLDWGKLPERSSVRCSYR